ncbi:helix-turn-helix domain-containing protein [Nocardia sp. NPDC004568]|uniref:helix-turn-helix domain-containing protein n=1 Tax=Nocardia sp. NPDC004568 TaxID=3154551 RepID=UPI0033B94F7E
MNINDTEVRAAFHAIDEFVRRRRRHGAGIPESVRRLHVRLYRDVRGEVDPEDTPDPRTADDEIGTTEAAALLGCSQRHIRRIAADLDGIRVGRDWIFNRRTVAEYAEARAA